MALLTGRSLAERGGPGGEVPVAAPVPVRVTPKVAGHRYRMHHPDSTPSSPITCEFELDGYRVKVERGVAIVPEGTAGALEASGWRRGSRL